MTKPDPAQELTLLKWDILYLAKKAITTNDVAALKALQTALVRWHHKHATARREHRPVELWENIVIVSDFTLADAEEREIDVLACSNYGCLMTETTARKHNLSFRSAPDGTYQDDTEGSVTIRDGHIV